MNNSDFYLEAIKHELEKLSPDFTGNISFQLNYKEGIVGNMNIGLGKSVRKIEPNYNAKYTISADKLV